ncbi:MAG TPA: trimethylamine methyltransferase family protein, partial [Candidatus Polarisedimenticolia bacterium]|nr:trimethylamine methyltransferase family protein [Candidatus Polarisedimenticolia bacterium]
MRTLALLSPETVDRILVEAFAVLDRPGVKVQSAAGLALLAEAGAGVDRATQVARIPEALARRALETVPRLFQLHDRDGAARVRYGGDAVHFDPGSAALHLLDPESGLHRDGVTSDLLRLIKVTEMLPQFDAQSTALVCSDVPAAIGDLYRLYLVLRHSDKPIVTGAFALETLGVMLEMLSTVGGDGGVEGV